MIKNMSLRANHTDDENGVAPAALDGERLFHACVPFMWHRSDHWLNISKLRRRLGDRRRLVVASFSGARPTTAVCRTLHASIVDFPGHGHFPAIIMKSIVFTSA